MGFSETCKAISDPLRRDILVLLKSGRLSAGEIAAHFQVTNASMSYHLHILKNADLIYETKYKNYIYYELNATMLDEVILWFEQLKGGLIND